MTETLVCHGFSNNPGFNNNLSDVSRLEGTIKVECSSDTFGTLMSSDESLPELDPSVTLKEQLQEISILNVVTHEEDLLTPLSMTGIEANDVGSLFKQFLEYENASDIEPLSYPDSSMMSPAASPGDLNEDVILGRLMCVQEKLTREVVGDAQLPPETASTDVVVNDNLVMNLPSDDNILRTINGIHPKGNLLRMADSPKFAKIRKKRLTNEPPLRIASSLPNTPRSTSPSDMFSSEERKHMEIKLIEALALPVAKPAIKNCKANNNKRIRKHDDKKLTLKRKQHPVEPIPSRLLPVVSKRQRNNLDKNKCKDPRLEKEFGNKDPRLNKADYCTKSNVIQLRNTNLIEINSSTNTASETVDDVGIIDMTIDLENITETLIVTNDDELLHQTFPFVTNNDDEILAATNSVINQTFPFDEIINVTSENETYTPTTINDNAVTINYDAVTISDGAVTISDDAITICNTTVICDPIVKCEPITPPQSDSCDAANDVSDLNIIEFPTITPLEVTVETSETMKSTANSPDSDILHVITSGLIKPEKNYRKTGMNRIFSSIGSTYSSGSDVESDCDDDDRAYNRKKSLKKPNPKYKKSLHSNSRHKTLHSCIKIEPPDPDRRSKSPPPKDSSKSSSRHHSRSPSSRHSRSPSSRHHSRSPSRHHSRSPSRPSRSPSRPKSRTQHRQRSGTYCKSKMKSVDRYSDESSFSSPDRSDDGEDVDINNKLIELSNPVPYDIEHERKLRFLSGGASTGLGERRNIYAGGITESTSKAELGERFRRFGQISKITLHFRDKGDNYAFIVFEDPDNAMRAIEEGNDDTTYPPLDLCFGGRRKFVGGSYVDFDGNNRYLEESDKAAVNPRCESPEVDFDHLLQMAMKETKKRDTTKETSRETAREPTQDTAGETAVENGNETTVETTEEPEWS